MLSAKSIKNHILKTPKLNKLYNIINPILFDVSLRDGIQGLKPEDMPYNKKIDTFTNIMKTMNPINMEIGSIVSPKILPIMNDTRELFKECSQLIENVNPLEELRVSGEVNYIQCPELYVLVPPKIEKIEKACDLGIKNISLITSVSESFIKKNTNMNMNDAMIAISNIYSKNNNFKNVKLYVSCINECPIEGKIELSKIIENLLFYESYCDELCISDTTGNLSYKYFKIIIDNCITYGINIDKISLHLHINDENYRDVENIIRYSLNKNIRRFDLSALSDGGCSVTMGKEKIKNNLTYDTFYEILIRYLNDYNGPDTPLYNNEDQKYSIKNYYTQDYLDNSFNYYNEKQYA